MSAPVISVEGIGKAYRIGVANPTHTNLGEKLIELAKTPLKRMRMKSEDWDDGEDTYWAIRNINFQVNQGEVCGIIGRNGAGKSTLLKVLSRITEPTEGLARVRGRVASLLEVGTGFHPELSGRENIFLNGAILGMSRAEIKRKFDEIVEFSEVSKFLDTPVKRYSSGM
jgi:lipopolysaccharide transport system ATP-binding protein